MPYAMVVQITDIHSHTRLTFFKINSLVIDSY
jgi:hypothetical protein